MNKKFSTLLAGVALLSAMSANAQTTPAQNVLPTANGAYSIGKLVEGDSILSCYDFFEWMVEELIDVIQFIFLRVAEIDGQKKVAVTVKGVENLSVLTEKKPELYVEQETEDEWFVSIKV